MKGWVKWILLVSGWALLLLILASLISPAQRATGFWVLIVATACASALVAVFLRKRR